MREVPRCYCFYCRTGDAISKDVAGEAIVLKRPELPAHYYGLNQVGAIVWNRLSIPCGADELASCVGSEFGLPAADVAVDVDLFLDDLLRLGLIEVRACAVNSAVPVPAQAGTAVPSRRYAAPTLERGLLRNAAHTELARPASTKSPDLKTSALY